MTDLFGGFVPEPSDPDPIRRAQIQMKKPLPKRFYQTVSVESAEGGFAIALDGRGIKTPLKNSLLVPSEALAQHIAAEWAAQESEINPAAMPMTRLANTAIDAVATTLHDVRDDILRFAGSDLLCYRADEPQELVARQSEKWDPVLFWLKGRHGAELQTIGGIMPQAQPQAALAAFKAALQPFETPFALSSLHVMTTLTGSAVLALAMASQHLTLETGWQLAHLDEDWTIEHWGDDEEAIARREKRFEDMRAAHITLFSL